jgi:hypothetical protein
MELKKIILTFVWLLLAACRMEASLVTFDNLSPTPEGTLVPNGYAGLRWTNFYALNGVTYVGGDSGYRRGVISGQNLVDNGYGKPATISGGIFDLASAYLTAAWNNKLKVTVIGRLGSTILYDNTYTLSAVTPTLINFNFDGIDSVQFISSGGRPYGYHGRGTHFGMDDVVINELTPSVPEPATVFAGALLLLPLGVGVIRRCRKA